ncbi:MAG: colicin immunity domain-containing protein [Chloroflexota bacterium]
MTRKDIQKPIITLINKFLTKQISADQFDQEYVPLWIIHRDLGYKQKESWPEPYDDQLMQQWENGELTDDEFEYKWLILWDSWDDRELHGLIDAINSACSVFNPNPMFEWEIDREQFYAEILEMVKPLAHLFDYPSIQIQMPVLQNQHEMVPVAAG